MIAEDTNMSSLPVHWKILLEDPETILKLSDKQLKTLKQEIFAEVSMYDDQQVCRQHPFVGNRTHLDQLRRAFSKNNISVWNDWRKLNADVTPDLRGIGLQGRWLDDIDLSQTWLHKADLSRTSLNRADLRGARLLGADLTHASLQHAKCQGANFNGAFLNKANLFKADLQNTTFLKSAKAEWANFNWANLEGAQLSGAQLEGANFTNAHLKDARLWRAILDQAVFAGTWLNGATLTQAHVHSVVVHNVVTDEKTVQGSLDAKFNLWSLNTRWYRSYQTKVDDIRQAHFLGSLEDQASIAHLVEASTTSSVLLLGRFTDERMRVLRTLESELKKRGKNPLIFNFERPEHRTVTETVRFLAGLCQFIIVDLTSPRSVPLELQAIVPQLMIPIVPIIQGKEDPFSMFIDLRKQCSWVLRPLRYRTKNDLVRCFDNEIVTPAEELHLEMRRWKARPLPAPKNISRKRRHRS